MCRTEVHLLKMSEDRSGIVKKSAFLDLLSRFINSNNSTFKTKFKNNSTFWTSCLKFCLETENTLYVSPAWTLHVRIDIVKFPLFSSFPFFVFNLQKRNTKIVKVLPFCPGSQGSKKCRNYIILFFFLSLSIWEPKNSLNCKMFASLNSQDSK